MRCKIQLPASSIWVRLGSTDRHELSTTVLIHISSTIYQHEKIVIVFFIFPFILFFLPFFISTFQAGRTHLLRKQRNRHAQIYASLKLSEDLFWGSLTEVCADQVLSPYTHLNERSPQKQFGRLKGFFIQKKEALNIDIMLIAPKKHVKMLN